MMSKAGRGARLNAGDLIPSCKFVDAEGLDVQIPDPTRLVHLQFRRFAACLFCNIHLRSFELRHDEIAESGIREVVVFRSTSEQSQHHCNVPYTLVLDPTGALYTAFGVESGAGAILSPRAILTALTNLVPSLRQRRIGFPPTGQRAKAILGIPADFLVGTDGRLVACEYGNHANDGWSVDELLTRARQHATAFNPLENSQQKNE
jgi:peroxiredoxin